MQPQSAQPSPVTLQDGTQLDPGVLKVMKAISTVESGGDYNAVGDNGQSHGAFQWNKDNFQNQAKSFGLDPNDMSPANQNQVAYKQIAAYKAQGLQPEEIAALWNGAKKNPDTGKFTYINPEYGQKFRAALQGNQSQGFNPTPYSGSSGAGAVNFSGVTNTQQPSNAGTFVGDVSDTLGQAGTGVANAAQQTMSGQINPLSGLIQAGGAIAGGVGGLVNNVAEHLPVVGGVVKGAENLVGQGVGAAAQTAPGQAVVKGIQGFQQAHPELAGDIGGAANIAGLVGGGFGGAAAKDVAEQGVKSALTKGFTSAAEGSLGETAANLADRSATKTAEKLLEEPATKGTVKAALKSGRAVGSADPLQTAEMNQVKGLVKAGKITRKMSKTEAAPLIQDAGVAETQSMRKAIQNSEVQPTVQHEDLQNLVNNVKKQAGESVVSGENPADKLLKVFFDNLPKGQDITAENVLDARQAVSQYVLQHAGDWSQRGVLTGFKSARNAFTNESRNLLIKLAPEVDIGGSLNKQAALYRAVERMAPAVSKEVNAAKKVVKHPLIKGLIRHGAKYAAEGAGLGAIMHYMP